MRTHTPGPWTNEESEITAEDGSVIAHVNTVDDFPCIDDDNDSSQMALLIVELEANARLIAASPTMAEYVIRKALEGDRDAEAIARSFGWTPQG